MNVLFLSTGSLKSIEDKGIYTDLLKELLRNKHNVYVACARERGLNLPTSISYEKGATFLRIRTGSLTKTNVIEKGFTTLTIGKVFLKAIKKHFPEIRFDLILYSTPPITFVGVVKYLKKYSGAKTFLLLKDIFPQNAVDLGMFGKRSIVYRYFRRKERKLYSLSDTIGCMSQANVDYVIKHNPGIPASKVVICPNSISVDATETTKITRNENRIKYGLPLNKRIFVYGGNLGKPQGIPFLIKTLKGQLDNEDAFFLIIGSGTEYKKIEHFLDNYKPRNMSLRKTIPKKKYDELIASCDIGMIFLDHRFTVPNFPSRLLSYMQAKLPVLACTDPNTDIGVVIKKGMFGWWCESNDPASFNMLLKKISLLNKHKLEAMGENAYKYLVENFSIENAYKTITGSLK